MIQTRMFYLTVLSKSTYDVTQTLLLMVLLDFKGYYKTVHPPPLSSIHLHSALPSSTQLSATPSTLLERKYRMQLGNFPKFRPKNSTLSAFTKNWHTWYVRGAVSRSGLRFLKFSPQNSFLGKFGLKKSKLSVLPKKSSHMVSWKS